jgi:hypothetical protein
VESGKHKEVWFLTGPRLEGMTMYDIMVLQGPNNTWASAEGVSSAGDYVAGQAWNVVRPETWTEC